MARSRVCLLGLLLFVPVLLATKECVNSDEFIDVHGIGASFSGEIFDNMGQRFAANRTHYSRKVNFRYNPVDSDNANVRILQKDDDRNLKRLLFASSTLPLSVEQKRKHPHIGIFPVFAAPMVIMYNLPGIANLTLSIKTLPRIYSGEIRFWNHEDIRQANPSLRLPHRQIEPIARLDASEDTTIFTEALSEFDVKWQSDFGVFDNPRFLDSYCCNSTKWGGHVRIYGRGHVGMVGVVSSIPYSIGYVSLGTMKLFKRITHASLYNSLGYKIDPTTQAVQNAMEYYRMQNPNKPPEYSIVNALQPDAYPIATFKYVIFNVSTTPGIACCQMDELVGFIVWVLDQPNEYFMRHGRAAITPLLARNIHKALRLTVYCDDGSSYEKFMDSIAAKDNTAATRMSIGFGAVCILGSLAGVVAYVVTVQRKKLSTISSYFIDSIDLRQKGDSSTSSLSIRGFDGLRAIYDQSLVMLFELNLINPKDWDRKTRKEVLHLLTNVNQVSIMQYLGFIYDQGQTYTVAEAATKGTLHSAFNESRLELDLNVRILVCLQICDGISYMHNKNMVHGSLSCQTCFLDSSWAVKLAKWLDYSIYAKCAPEEVIRMYSLRLEELKDDNIAMFWYADPRSKQGVVDKETDMFAIGMILFEIVGGVGESRGDIGREMMKLLNLRFNNGKVEFPKADRDVPKDVDFLIHMCTNMNPESRPSISFVIETLKKLRLTHRGIVDILMQSLESYRSELEKSVEERTAELTRKTEEMTSVGNKMEELLHEVLPPAIATKLLRNETVEPEYFESVTIYFSDIVGFTEICSASNPMQIIGFLNDLWRLFDTLIGKYDVYKVDTIGDSYMVCSGLPHRNGDEHARQICLLAIDLFASCPNFRFAHLPTVRLKIRIGINSGAVTAGVVGSKMPQYCVFGDAVNVASRMQSTAETMTIQVSQHTHDILEASYGDQFSAKYRGEVECKGKGMMKTYTLLANTTLLNQSDHRITAAGRSNNTSIMPMGVPLDEPPPLFPIPISAKLGQTDGHNGLVDLTPVESAFKETEDEINYVPLKHKKDGDSSSKGKTHKVKSKTHGQKKDKDKVNLSAI